MKIRVIIIGALLLTALLPRMALATDYGVFVDGAYNKGETVTDMDRLVDSRVDEAKRIFDTRHPGGQSHRVDNSSGLATTLGNIQCSEGDTITIVMMGHGGDRSKYSGPENFFFAKENKSVSVDNLSTMLKSATIGCDCKIYVVIFSCHSGSFIKKLLKDKHVKSVHTSCATNEKSSAYIERRWDPETQTYVFTETGKDWMKGFNEDWQAAQAGSDRGDALQEAARTAKQKMPPGSTVAQHPQGWRMGDVKQVKAHVEVVQRDKLKVTFYDPEFMRNHPEILRRSARGWVGIKGATLPDTPLKRCDWIEFDATFGDPATASPVNTTDTITRTTAPTERIVAHVRKRGNGWIQVFIVEPTWLYGTTRVIKVDQPGQIADNIQPCKWIQQNVTITDPTRLFTTTDNVGVATITFRVKAHVGRKNSDKRTVRITILEPKFLRYLNGQKPKLQLPRATFDRLKNCDNIWMTFNPHPNAQGFYTATDIRKIVSKGNRTHFSFFDAAVDSVFEPEFTREIGATVNPKAVFRNVGQNPLAPFMVECIILREGIPIYADQQEVQNGDVGSSTNITFSEWTPDEIGNHEVVFQVFSSEDENPLNNTISMTTTVTPPNTWPTAGDANLDGTVNILDMLFVRNRLREDPLSGDDWQADLNEDGAINILDLIFTRNHLGDDAETTPPFTRQFVWEAEGTINLPPEVGGGVQPLHMNGWTTWRFEPTETPGLASMSLEDVRGTISPLDLLVDIDDDGQADPVNTGELLFDTSGADFQASWGTVDMRTDEFSVCVAVLPVATSLEPLGIDAFVEPLFILLNGTMDLRAFDASGSFNVGNGLLAGAVATFSVQGAEARTMKLSSKSWRVEVTTDDGTAPQHRVWLQNLNDIPDQKVTVIALVSINGTTQFVQGELEVRNGSSTQGLKIGEPGDEVEVDDVQIVIQKE